MDFQQCTPFLLAAKDRGELDEKHLLDLARLDAGWLLETLPELATSGEHDTEHNIISAVQKRLLHLRQGDAQPRWLGDGPIPSASAIGNSNADFQKFLKNYNWYAYRTWSDCGSRHVTPLATLSSAVGLFEDVLTKEPSCQSLLDAQELCQLLSQVFVDEVKGLQPDVKDFFRRWRANISDDVFGSRGDHSKGEADYRVQTHFPQSLNTQQHKYATLLLVKQNLDSGGNAVGQLMSSYVHELHQNQELFLRSRVPMFLLAIQGTNLHVSAAAHTDRLLSEPVATITCIDREQNIQQTAQVLEALKQDFTGAQVTPTSSKVLFELRWPQHNNRANTFVKLVKANGLHQGLEDPLPIAAQKAYAALKLAPAVLDYQPLGAGWYAVHMEGLNANDGWQTLYELSPLTKFIIDIPIEIEERWEKIKAGVLAAQATAHTTAMVTINEEQKLIVHGDSRLNNISARNHNNVWEFRWFDFDWAGVHEVSKYPAIMNRNILWAAGAGPGQIMLQQHDVEVLQKQLEGQFSAVEF